METRFGLDAPNPPPPRHSVVITTDDLNNVLAPLLNRAELNIVTTHTASGSFDFDYDVYDWPDWLAAEFVDVRGKIQLRASERISGAFAKDTSHAASEQARRATRHSTG
jgi:hypothetical protein